MQRVYEENEWGKVSKRIVTDDNKGTQLPPLNWMTFPLPLMLQHPPFLDLQSLL